MIARPRLAATAATVCLMLIGIEAAASSPISMVPFVPRDARSVIGLDLDSSPYEEFSGAARLYLAQAPAARRLFGWIQAAKLEIIPDAALAIEDGRGQTAIIIELDALRDSHWLRLEALMKLDGFTLAPGRGGGVWTSQGDAPQSYTRLNDRLILAGDSGAARAVLDGVRTRRKPRGELAEMLGQVPAMASAWFVSLPLDPRAARTGCQAGSSGHLILDDGLLTEIVWRCSDVASANAHRKTLTADLASPEMAREMAILPGLAELATGALIQRVGDDVMLVLNATDAETRDILGHLRDISDPPPNP